MEKIDGKYFEQVITELKKVREEENIQPSQQFRANLRAKIVERASVMQSLPETEKFSLGNFVSRWKYLLGLVPTMAVLAIVAANVANFQVKMKSPEYLPTQISQPKPTENTQPAQIQEVSSVQPIKTFSADLALPPADILDKYLAKQNGETNLMEISINNGEINLSAVTSDNSKLDFSGNIANLKITAPKIQGTTAPAKESRPAETTNDTVPVYSVMPQQIFGNPQTGTAENFEPVLPSSSTNQNNLQTSQPTEQSGRVEQNQKLNTLSAPTENTAVNTFNINTTANNQVQTSIPAVGENNQINPAVQNSVAPNIDSNTQITGQNVANQTQAVPPVNNIQSADTSSANVIIPSGMEKVREDFGVNAIDNSVRNEMVTGSVDPSRIQYSGRDFSLVENLINREFSRQDRQSNYSFVVSRMDSGTLKVEYYENAQIRKLLFLKLIDGEYRNVTEINF